MFSEVIVSTELVSAEALQVEQACGHVCVEIHRQPCSMSCPEESDEDAVGN